MDLGDAKYFDTDELKRRVEALDKLNNFDRIAAIYHKTISTTTGVTSNEEVKANGVVGNGIDGSVDHAERS